TNIRCGWRPSTLVTTTMEPPSGMFLTASRTVRNIGDMFILTVASHPDSGTWSTGPSPNRRPLPPATASTPSRRPNRSRQAEKAASAADSSVRSAVIPSMRSDVWRNRSMGSWSRDTTNTEPPSDATRSAVEAPMPVAPVTSTVRPEKRWSTGGIMAVSRGRIGDTGPGGGEGDDRGSAAREASESATLEGSMTDETRSETTEESKPNWSREAQEALDRTADAVRTAWDATRETRASALEAAKQAVKELGEALEKGLEVAKERWESETAETKPAEETTTETAT